MTRLTFAQRNKAIGMLICGTSNPEVAVIFRVQTSTFSRIRYRCNEKTNSARKSGKIGVVGTVSYIGLRKIPDTLIRNVVGSMPKGVSTVHS